MLEHARSYKTISSHATTTSYSGQNRRISGLTINEFFGTFPVKSSRPLYIPIPEVQVVAYLLVQRPGQTDDRFILTDRQVTVGRLPDNELVIDEPSVSRHHVRIIPSHEGHTIVDLASRNGLWVNGQRANQTSIPLRHGDELAVGGQGVLLRYLVDEATTDDVTSFFLRESSPLPQRTQGITYESERWMKVLRTTPWLQFVAAVAGSAAAILALIWWTIRFLSA